MRSGTSGRELYCPEISYGGNGGVACWLEPEHEGEHWDWMLNVAWHRTESVSALSEVVPPPKHVAAAVIQGG